MQLLFLWVEEFRNIKEKGFSFSSDFKISYDYNTVDSPFRVLSIQDIPENDVDFFDPIISNVTAIIGKNGSGKTNILDLIGMRMNDRERLGNPKYFMIYHHDNNVFSIEGSNHSIVNSFVDINEKVLDTFSVLFKYENGEIINQGFLHFQNNEHNKVNIFNFRNNFRNDYDAFNFKMDSESSSIFFDRFYLIPARIGYYAKYRMLTFFNNNNERFYRNNIFNFNDNIHIKIENNNISNKEFKEKYRLLNLNSLNNKKMLKKDNFIINVIEGYLFNSISHYEEISSNIKREFLSEQLSEVNKTERNKKKTLLKLLEIVIDNISIVLKDGNKKKYFIVFNKLINYLETLPDKYFYNSQINIPIRSNEDEVYNIKDFLEFVDKHYFSNQENYLNNVIRISFEPFSAGEEAFLNLFASLYFGLNFDKPYKKHTGIILLDEPDTLMHPEWSRILLSEVFNLLKIIDNYERYQLIITTHSPFIVSDLPKNKVIALEKDKISGESIVSNLYNVETFASNIHSLFSDSFFMDSTYGKFATCKIDQVIELINSKRKLNEGEIKKVEFIVSIIGEPILKKKLEQMFQETFEKDSSYNKLQIKREIIRLKAEYEKLVLEDDSNKP